MAERRALRRRRVLEGERKRSHALAAAQGPHHDGLETVCIYMYPDRVCEKVTGSVLTPVCQYPRQWRELAHVKAPQPRSRWTGLESGGHARSVDRSALCARTAMRMTARAVVLHFRVRALSRQLEQMRAIASEGKALASAILGRSLLAVEQYRCVSVVSWLASSALTHYAERVPVSRGTASIVRGKARTTLRCCWPSAYAVQRSAPCLLAHVQWTHCESACSPQAGSRGAAAARAYPSTWHYVLAVCVWRGSTANTPFAQLSCPDTVPAS